MSGKKQSGKSTSGVKSASGVKSTSGAKSNPGVKSTSGTKSTSGVKITPGIESSGPAFQLLPASVLKWIAIVTMLIDHIAASLLMERAGEVYATIDFESQPSYSEHPEVMIYLIYALMRTIGRLAFPIFAYFVVEGFMKTRNRLKYIGRMALFALVSEVPFDLAFSGVPFAWGHQNVGLELLLGLLMMTALDWLFRYFGAKKWGKTTVGKIIIYMMSLIFLGAFAYLGIMTHSDYSMYGLILMYVLYVHKRNEKRGSWLAPLVASILFLFLERTIVPGLLFTFLYNGEKGKQSKWLFYIFYPAHLLLLGLIGMFVL